MLVLLFSVFSGCAVGCGLGFTHVASPGWSIFWGILGMVGVYVGGSLVVRSKVKKVMEGLQATMVDGQRRLQQRATQLQMRPPGSVKQMMEEMERIQKPYLQKALEQTRDLEPLHKWAFMLSRQTATVRMQLNYQLRDFAEVDRLMPDCLIVDPMTAAMKLARMHVRKDPGQDKFFERQAARFRYGQGALFYSLQSWSLVQRGDVKGAHAVLVRACDHMENETINRNRDNLANNRVKHFSNSGLGDEWYALGLEQPRVKFQRPRGPIERMR